MKRNHIFSLIGLIIIALIVLVVALPDKENKTKKVVEEESLAFSAPEVFEGEGEMVYSFDGIQWDLDLIEAGSARIPETRVGFFFDNFTRRENGVPAVFGSPFHLGFYKGDCTVLDVLPDNPVLENIEGAFISGIACMWSDEASLALLVQNGKLVTAYDISGQQPEVLNMVREIDITTIVE